MRPVTYPPREIASPVLSALPVATAGPGWLHRVAGKATRSPARANRIVSMKRGGYCYAMSGPYFHKTSWGSYTYQGQTYDLTHLDEYQLAVEDSRKVTRPIAVTFSDHCFTREPRDGDDPALVFAPSSRNTGYFCVERYQLSLNLTGYIAQATTRTVWHLGHDGYAVVPTIDHRGRKIL